MVSPEASPEASQEVSLASPAARSSSVVASGEVAVSRDMVTRARVMASGRVLGGLVKVRKELQGVRLQALLQVALLRVGPRPLDGPRLRDGLLLRDGSRARLRDGPVVLPLGSGKVVGKVVLQEVLPVVLLVVLPAVLPPLVELLPAAAQLEVARVVKEVGALRGREVQDLEVGLIGPAAVGHRHQYLL